MKLEMGVVVQLVEVGLGDEVLTPTTETGTATAVTMAMAPNVLNRNLLYLILDH